MTELSKEILKLKDALEEAEQRNQKKNDFLNRMSHEIRTPLNAIIGLSYLSKESETMPAKVYENLDKIEQSAHFLLSFVNDILSLSDLEAGKIALAYDVVENELYFEELKQDIKKLTDAKVIHFTFSIRGEMEKYYVFDSEKLKKALMYVVASSIKATPTGGNIDVTVEVLSQDESEAKLQFVIKDNGLGIDETVLPTVFEPFQQVYGESRTLYSGSGLELAITKNIVELMQGSISVESKKGEGSVFTLCVNLKQEHRHHRFSAIGGDTKIHYDFTGKRALIVEDSDINIEIAKNILLHKHFAVEIALNGEDAVKMFMENEVGYYDVILMDIRMPVMDGLEATQQIRNAKKRPDGAKIPIVAMTANAFEEDVKKSLEAGMNGHLSKPIEIKKMYALLYALLETEE